MMLVGFSGSIGSGKTSLAEAMAVHARRSGHWESWQIIAEVGNDLKIDALNIDSPRDYNGINSWLKALPAIVEVRTRRHMDPELAVVTTRKVEQTPELYTKLFEYIDNVYQQPNKQTELITLETKERYRTLLQWLGGYLAKSIAGDIWYTEIVRQISAEKKLDFASVSGVRFPADAAPIHRAGGFIIGIERPSAAARDSSDVTEREVSQVPLDALVTNNGNFTQLQACGQRIYTDLTQHNLQPNYITSQF